MDSKGKVKFSFWPHNNCWLSLGAAFVDEFDLFYCHCCGQLLQEERGASEIVGDRLNSKVLDQHNCWSSLLWLIIVRMKEKGLPFVLTGDKVDWHSCLIAITGWLLCEEGESCLLCIKSRKYLTNTIVDQICFGWLLLKDEEGERCPLCFELIWGRLTQLLIGMSGWLLQEEGERYPLCIELRQGWLTQLLIDVTGWLLSEEGESTPLCIESGRGRLTQLLIGITGWLLWEEGGRSFLHIIELSQGWLTQLLIDIMLDWHNHLIVSSAL